MLYGVSEFISVDEYERTVEELAEEIAISYPEVEKSEASEALAATYDKDSDIIQFLYNLGIQNAYRKLAEDIYSKTLHI